MNQVTRWHTSSYSNQETNCVEVGRIGGGAAVRDSKDRAAGFFTATAPEWAAFLAAVRDGRYQR
ncbi:DUF397 domain-containing protein [Saccharopolyspora sp. CA-218241]|uniref:DUF397 domain-containing protein n=1 Tax=Saccharopolyspora sp. CA-218241 TaxID=3240027 RepID=UPI003D965311